MERFQSTTARRKWGAFIVSASISTLTLPFIPGFALLAIMVGEQGINWSIEIDSIMWVFAIVMVFLGPLICLISTYLKASQFIRWASALSLVGYFVCGYAAFGVLRNYFPDPAKGKNAIIKPYVGAYKK